MHAHGTTQLGRLREGVRSQKGECWHSVQPNMHMRAHKEAQCRLSEHHTPRRKPRKEAQKNQSTHCPAPRAEPVPAAVASPVKGVSQPGVTLCHENGHVWRKNARRRVQCAVTAACHRFQPRSQNPCTRNHHAIIMVAIERQDRSVLPSSDLTSLRKSAGAMRSFKTNSRRRVVPMLKETSDITSARSFMEGAPSK